MIIVCFTMINYQNNNSKIEKNGVPETTTSEISQNILKIWKAIFVYFSLFLVAERFCHNLICTCLLGSNEPGCECSERHPNIRIKHINNFTYHLWGKLLDKNVLDVGFYITSDLFEDYQYLAGEYVSLVVDRLQVYCE